MGHAAWRLPLAPASPARILPQRSASQNPPISMVSPYASSVASRSSVLWRRRALNTLACSNAWAAANMLRAAGVADGMRGRRQKWRVACGSNLAFLYLSSAAFVAFFCQEKRRRRREEGRTAVSLLRTVTHCLASKTRLSCHFLFFFSLPISAPLCDWATLRRRCAYACASIFSWILPSATALILSWNGYYPPSAVLVALEGWGRRTYYLFQATGDHSAAEMGVWWRLH